jgi:hypothetical protein
MFSTTRLYTDSVMIGRNVADFAENTSSEANLQLRYSQLILRKCSPVFLVTQSSLVRAGDACSMETKVPLFNGLLDPSRNGLTIHIGPFARTSPGQNTQPGDGVPI